MAEKYNYTNRILIVGAGYVGLAYACFLAKKFSIDIVDTDKKKIESFKNGDLSLKEKKLSEEFKLRRKNIFFSTKAKNYNYDFIILCLPTNYEENKNQFNTSSLEIVAKEITKNNKNPRIVIKSTVPVGFTKKLKKDLNADKILFSPEFLKEGTSLSDVKKPDRVITGCQNNDYAKDYIELIKSCMTKKDLNETTFLTMDESEAEAVKLFSNTYLALRVAFFNELDTFCMNKKLKTQRVIEGISSDKRIGHGYNNPSFGYGGYCLPKDSKQLLTNYDTVPQDIISSVVTANETRKRFIANEILNMNENHIGIYRLTMKSGADNYRESSILSIIELIKTKKDIVIYEPLIHGDNFNNIKVTNNLEEFISSSEIIIANRLDENLINVREKVFTRDLYGKN